MKFLLAARSEVDPLKKSKKQLVVSQHEFLKPSLMPRQP
jgi:hypothetical protein